MKLNIEEAKKDKVFQKDIFTQAVNAFNGVLQNKAKCNGFVLNKVNCNIVTVEGYIMEEETFKHLRERGIIK